jgi:hypothetical protein
VHCLGDNRNNSDDGWPGGLEAQPEIIGRATKFF